MMSQSASAAEQRCPRCGVAQDPASAEGLCPRCLVAMNLAPMTEALTGATNPVAAEAADPSADALPPLPEIARRFPHLEILECLGRGGMGVVYRARQPQLNRLVALKLLAPGKAQEASFTERFAREAQALARLSHQHIVTIYDFGQVDGLYYLLMEYVDGTSLRQLLQSHQITPEQALAIVPRICDALQYAHDHGIVHRDIKPENILLDRQGQVKIADFGIAKMRDNGRPQPALTLDKQVIGTPHYMAPEQVENPRSVDHRADIYSLGVVFYELLTGELPLGQFQPPSKKAPVDARLDHVVLGALAKEPDRRYQQASQVQTEVETIATTPVPPANESVPNPALSRDPLPLASPEEASPAPATASPSSPADAWQEPDPADTRAKRTALIAGFLTVTLLLGMIGLGAFFWPGIRGPQPSSVPPPVEQNPPVAESPPPMEQTPRPRPHAIPPRTPEAGRNLIDLGDHYNAALDVNWNDPFSKDNHLGELPFGVQTLAGTSFEVRGLVQVEQGSRKFPDRIEGIVVGQKCHRLHFLHAAGNAALIQDGTEIGCYVVHLANGDQHRIPIVLGQDVLDWWKQPRPGLSLVVAWEGDNPKSRQRADGRKIRLFKSTWENPSPEVEVRTLDFLSARPGPAPFLVALTAE
jgi:serine/threonine protein kinase